MLKVYGIKNCSTVKKALLWLEQHNIPAILHDYRVDGIDDDWLVEAEKHFGWQSLLNKRSTTWRTLPDETKSNLNRETSLKLLKENPVLIKRPIILQANIALIGFDENEYTQQLNG